MLNDCHHLDPSPHDCVQHKASIAESIALSTDFPHPDPASAKQDSFRRKPCPRRSERVHTVSSKRSLVLCFFQLCGSLRIWVEGTVGPLVLLKKFHRSGPFLQPKLHVNHNIRQIHVSMGLVPTLVTTYALAFFSSNGASISRVPSSNSSLSFCVCTQNSYLSPVGSSISWQYQIAC